MKPLAYLGYDIHRNGSLDVHRLTGDGKQLNDVLGIKHYIFTLAFQMFDWLNIKILFEITK